MVLLTRPWRHIFDFRSRATRSEYWLFQLQVVLIFFLARIATRSIADSSHPFGAVHMLLALMLALLLTATVIASFASAFRRLHDHGKSGLFVLVWFIPFGALAFLILMALPGTKGENRYGYDPRQGDRPAIEDMAAVFT